MKKVFLFFIVFVLTVDVTAQRLIPNSSITGVSLAGSKTNRMYIPPPKKFINRPDSKGARKITVSYSGFTDQAKAAVEYAVSILETLLPADTKIFIKATSTKISTTGVLGNSSITGYAPGWAVNALNPMAYYPVTVAEKIAGKNLNEDNEADIELILNNSINWYYGTDGNTPLLKYDLVTVVLHELCHGLGFFDSTVAENNTASYEINSVPVVYDTFVENLTGEKLTDTTLFKQGSNSLYLELTGDQLYFNGPLVNRYTSGIRPRLYAPSTWESGSSVSHLDETRTSAENSLMTPYIDKGEAIHDPGDLTLSILGDVGWINTRILPNQLKDTEDHLTSLEISASIRSDTVYNRNKVGLVYSFDDFKTSDTLMMISPSANEKFSRTVPIPSYNIRMKYFLYTEDDFLRLYRSPSLAEKNPYSVFIGTDTVRPVIIHNPGKYYFELIDSVLFDATATDNLGIDTVYIEYKVNDRPVKYFGLSAKANDKFSYNLNVKSELLKGGDSLQYRIIAVDKAAGKNVSVSPASGYYSIRIETLKPALSSYTTDFSDAGSDFFNSGFQITKPSDFSSPGLHSDHSYGSPEADDASLDFSSVLRHPVKFNSSGMVISFRELVLVEPGEEGSVYGSSDFYDYVVLEGSKDFGKNWFSLADGYDSRIIPAWGSAYNSSVDGQNSTYVGKESMMVNHTFYPKISDKISDGDSLLIRFRLYSDPYAHGWGWAIDDLEIHPLIDQVEEISSNDLKVYPNPGTGQMTIIPDSNGSSGPVMISVYSSIGQCVMNNITFTDNEIKLDISNSPSGLYFIIIKNGNRIKTVKYSLIK